MGSFRIFPLWSLACHHARSHQQNLRKKDRHTNLLLHILRIRLSLFCLIFPHAQIEALHRLDLHFLGIHSHVNSWSNYCHVRPLQRCASQIRTSRQSNDRAYPHRRKSHHHMKLDKITIIFGFFISLLFFSVKYFDNNFIIFSHIFLMDLLSPLISSKTSYKNPFVSHIFIANYF